MHTESQYPADTLGSSSMAPNETRLTALRSELEYLNTIGKRFVAAFDRFQVHRALLTALQELYTFSACCILLKGNPPELFVISCYPLDSNFFESMIQRIINAAHALDFPPLDLQQLTRSAYLDAPDELARPRPNQMKQEIGSSLNLPMTVDNRIIGLLSLFDEQTGTFDRNLLQMTTIIADYAAVSLENVRLRERENALWRQTELERQRLELILGSMAEGLVITNARGVITSMNEAATYMLAQAELDIQIHSSLPRLARSKEITWLSRLVALIDQALAGETITNQELIIGQSSENIQFTLSISAAPLHESNNKRALGVVVMLNDVTSIRQVDKMKDEFVSVVSHELRTPLTAIKGYTQHLVRRLERRIRQNQSQTPAAELPETYDLRSLSIIQSQSDHLERLVNDLLDLSQVQWGELELHYESFSLANLLNELIRSVQPSAEQHNLHLEINAQETTVSADRLRISQVLGNILDNAIKYSPQGSVVTVRLQEKSGMYLISVMDQGVGISPEHLRHIFERFYRVHNTASHQYTGIGLGLYVARAIIEKHGGKIWFTTTIQAGSTFHFTIPQTPSEEKTI